MDMREREEGVSENMFRVMERARFLEMYMDIAPLTLAAALSCTRFHRAQSVCDDKLSAAHLPLKQVRHSWCIPHFHELMFASSPLSIVGCLLDMVWFVVFSR